MSRFATAAAPPAANELAVAVADLLARRARTAPQVFGEASRAVETAQPRPPAGGALSDSLADQLVAGPLGVGTAATRRPWAFRPPAPCTVPRAPLPRGLRGPGGLGTSGLPVVRPAPAAPAAAASAAGAPPASGTAVEDLYYPPALRDDPALGEAINEALVAWAGEMGIYAGQLGKVRRANFGRLVMLTHPGTDDPDRLLAASKCILAEWATDDHFLDDQSLGADPAVISSRLAMSYGAIDPVDLPARYAPQFEEALAGEPVSVAYR